MRMRMPFKKGATALLVVALVVLAPVGVSAAGLLERATFEEQSLQEALQALQEAGLAILFSNQVVRPSMKVLTAPTATEPRAVLDEVLAPHGLRAVEEAGGVLVVVRAAVEEAGPGNLLGEVRARNTEEPVAAATVEVLDSQVGTVSSAANGRFSFSGLEPGAYTLEARAPGFVTERVEGVVVDGGHMVRLTVFLKPEPFVHDEIVVRSSEISLLQEEPSAPLSFDREAMDALPILAGDFFRATSLLPGVAGNDVSAGFSIHGGRRDEVKIILDGQELYESYHLKDYDGALSIVPAQQLSGATLSTGAFPADDGDRMGGVLDLTTFTPTAKSNTLLSLSVVDALLLSSGTFGGGRGRWLGSARRGFLDLAGKVTDNERPTFWDAFAKVELSFGDASTVWVRFLATEDDLEFEEQDEDDFKRFDTSYDNRYGWLTYQVALGSRLLVETTPSWSVITRDRGGIEAEEEGTSELRDQRELRVAGISQTWGFQARPEAFFAWGWEARRYDVVYDYESQLEPEFVVRSPYAVDREGGQRFARSLRGDHLGIWGSHRFSPTDSVTVELGGRYDRHTLTDDTLWSPRLSAAWSPRENTVLRASWGHFFQSQRPYELQVEDGQDSFVQAERTEHWVIGYEHLLKRELPLLQAFRVEVYQRQVTDPRDRFENLLEPINTFPEVEPDRVRIQPERATARGVELVLRGTVPRGKIGKRIDWWLAYSYSKSENQVNGVSVPRLLDQPQVFNLSVSFHAGKHWRVNLAGRYHSGWPTTRVETLVLEDDEGEEELVPVFGPLNAKRLPEYHRLDLRLSRQWKLSRGELTFFLDLQNVYDRQNVSGFEIVVEEDQEIILQSVEAWPGAFPSLGLSWKF